MSWPTNFQSARRNRSLVTRFTGRRSGWSHCLARQDKCTIWRRGGFAGWYYHVLNLWAAVGVDTRPSPEVPLLVIVIIGPGHSKLVGLLGRAFSTDEKRQKTYLFVGVPAFPVSEMLGNVEVRLSIAAHFRELLFLLGCAAFNGRPKQILHPCTTIAIHVISIVIRGILCYCL